MSTQKTFDLLIKEGDLYIDKNVEFQKTFHNHLIAISSGAIVLSLNLISFKTNLIFLKSSWILFSLVLISSIFRNLSFSKYFHSEGVLSYLLAHHISDGRTDKNNIENKRDKALKFSKLSNYLSWISSVFFILGFISLLLFGMLSIK